jgi:hypothetical protein
MEQSTGRLEYHAYHKWSRILLQKLTVAQLIKKFSVFYRRKAHYRAHKSIVTHFPHMPAPDLDQRDIDPLEPSDNCMYHHH